jgi:hypothetical protein
MTDKAKPGWAWTQSLLLGLAVFVVYEANGREYANGDTFPAKLLPIAILRGEGPFLDRFRQHLAGPATGAPLPYWLAERRGHLMSTYPVGTALLAVPFYLPQVLYLDWRHPGWEATTDSLARYSTRMAKNAAAGIGALTTVALFHLLRRLGLVRVALPAACGVALGSNLWMDSQTLWQHVPAALALTLSLALLVPAPVSRLQLCLAGLTTAALVCFRLQDALLAVVIFLWVLRHQPQGLPWFLPFPVLLGAALVGYNYWFFGTPMGGYGVMEGGAEYFSLRPIVLLRGVAGNLWSPRRSLFVYCPWVALALATLPAVVHRLRSWSLVCWLLWALIPYLLLYSANTGWWGGHYFGPRYFTDVLPLLTILLAVGLSWSWARCRPAFLAFVVSLAFAAGAQYIGAFYYPSSWESSPVNIDDTVEQGNSKRAWDWRDNELTRCLREGPFRRRHPDAPYWLTGFAESPPPPP